MLDRNQPELGLLMTKLQLWTERAANSKGVKRAKALQYKKFYQDRVRALINEPSDHAEVEPANCFSCILLKQQGDMGVEWQSMPNPTLEEVVEGLKSVGATFPILEERLSLPPLCSKCSDVIGKVMSASRSIAKNP